MEIPLFVLFQELMLSQAIDLKKTTNLYSVTVQTEK